jgi:hypothetical protein
MHFSLHTRTISQVDSLMAELGLEGGGKSRSDALRFALFVFRVVLQSQLNSKAATTILTSSSLKRLAVLLSLLQGQACPQAQARTCPVDQAHVLVL